MQLYKVEFTQPFVYVDSGYPVNGYRVQIRILYNNELHDLYVKSLDPDLVNGKALDFVEQRLKLDQLGKPPEG
jgi:hypothetical protein